jgi:hypothetical protein
LPYIEQFLLPNRVVKLLYRGKIQGLLKQALKEQTVLLPPDMNRVDFNQLYQQAYRKEWSVRIEER